MRVAMVNCKFPQNHYEAVLRKLVSIFRSFAPAFALLDRKADMHDKLVDSRRLNSDNIVFLEVGLTVGTDADLVPSMSVEQLIQSMTDIVNSDNRPVLLVLDDLNALELAYAAQALSLFRAFHGAIAHPDQVPIASAFRRCSKSA